MTIAAPPRTLTPGTYPVPITDITIGHRLRRLDEAKVLRLVESIGMVGLQAPVKIDTLGELVAGAHRLEAERRRGETAIRADVCEYASPALRRLAEIEDNWQSANLSHLERAEHFADRVECYRGLGKLARPADTQFRETPMESGPAIISGPEEDRVTMASLTSDWGVSDRQGRTWLRVARLPQKVRDLVSFTAVGDSLKDLVELGNLPEAELLPVAEVLGVDGKLKSVRAALHKLYPDRYAKPPDEVGWDDSDIPERMKIVGFTGELSFIVPNEAMRKRPGGQVAPREAELEPHTIELQWGVDAREAGMEGLRGIAGEIAKAIYSDEAIRRDWVRIP